MADDRNHKAVRRLRRDAKVHSAEAGDDVVVVVVMGVDLREFGDRLDDGEHEERQQGELRPLFGRARVEGSAQFLERGDVDLLDIREMRDPARRLGHVLGDAPAKAGDLDRLDRSCWAPVTLLLRRRRRRAGDDRRRDPACVMRPAGPEPRTNRRSTPASRAFRRTAGEASGFSPGGRGAPVCRAGGGRRPSRRLLRRLLRARLCRLGLDGLGFDARRRRLDLLRARFRRRGEKRIGKARRVDANELGADREHVPDRAAEREHAARHGRGDFDRRLVGHDGGDDLILLDEIADLDRPFDDLGFRHPFADVGHPDRAHAHHEASIAFKSARPTRAGPGK